MSRKARKNRKPIGYMIIDYLEMMFWFKKWF